MVLDRISLCITCVKVCEIVVVEGGLCVIFHAFSFFLFLSLVGYHLILKLTQLVFHTK